MTWQETAAFAAVIGALVNTAGLIYGFGKLSQQVQDLRASREQNDRHHDEMFSLIRSAELDAAKTYVKVEALDKIKAEMIAAVNRLADRVDRVLDRRDPNVAGK